jgi:hypothetical protein
MAKGLVGVVAMGCLLALGVSPASAQSQQQEIDALKQILERQEQSIQELKQRIRDLENGTKPAAPVAAPAAPAAPPPPAVAEPDVPRSPAEEMEAKLRAEGAFGRPSPITDRRNLDDRQSPAPRPSDYTFDPTYRGYIPIPNTVFMVKFNPKPRLDLTMDSQNSGDDFRFVPAFLPLKGQAAHGGGEQFNMNANGSQLRLDIRAPVMAGNFRVYYQNDFFGSDTRNMQYRLQHFYAQYYGIVGGFTYGVFEDPDSWPDTVDYEGPNSVIFARRPLLHYTLELADDWNFTMGIEDPDIYLDTSSQPNAQLSTRAPDGGFNLRWEPGELGHMQFSTILRSIGANSTTNGDQDVFGWGVNLSAVFNVTERDTLLGLVVYGQGVGGMGNDTSFVNSDAAFSTNGDLVALDYVSALGAVTHAWTSRWRSTATFGYVNLQNAGGQPNSAYDFTYYASGNLVYQLYKRLSIGAEVLYGLKEVKSGNTGDDVRFQLGVVYSVFD